MIDLDGLHHLANAIAPELDPLYITDGDDMPGVSHPHSGGGYCTLTTDSVIRQLLVDRGDWRGPGPTIVLFDGASQGVFLHELGHLLPARKHRDREPTDADLIADREFHAYRLTQPESTARPGCLPWKLGGDHGAPFIRRCLHLHFRAHLAGFRIIPKMVAGEFFGLSSLSGYAAAIQDEPHRLMDATFAEIEATPAPIAFTELWISDIQRWQEDNTDGNRN